MADAIDDGLIKALVEAVRAFLREGTRVAQRSDEFLTVVIERKDKSDPHWKLCEALEAYDAAELRNARALSRHKAPLSVAGDDVIVAVRDAIWREDHYDPKLCSHNGDGGRSCAYCEPHDDPTPEDWPADKERAERQARAALTALQVTEGDKRLWMFLEILSAAGGVSDASDFPGNWTAAFCEDHEGRDPDTFNQAIDHGYVDWSHDSDSDCSTIRLTEKGRAALHSKQEGEGR